MTLNQVFEVWNALGKVIQPCEHWGLPARVWIKVNFDGNLSARDGNDGAGFVIRDSVSKLSGIIFHSFVCLHLWRRLQQLWQDSSVRYLSWLALLLYVCVAHTHEPNPDLTWRRPEGSATLYHVEKRQQRRCGWPSSLHGSVDKVSRGVNFLTHPSGGWHGCRSYDGSRFKRYCYQIYEILHGWGAQGYFDWRESCEKLYEKGQNDLLLSQKK